MEGSRTVALFDICQTLVQVTTINDFTEHFLLSPLRNPHFSFRMWCLHQWYQLRRALHSVSPQEYREHFFRLYRGQGVENISRLAEQYSEWLEVRLKKSVVEIMLSQQRNGIEIYFVTAGLSAYLKPFARKFNATLIATDLEAGAATYTGGMSGIDCVGEGKVTKIRSSIPDFSGVDLKKSFAFSDSESDIPLLSLVGNPSVVNPDSALREYARVRGWPIIE